MKTREAEQAAHKWVAYYGSDVANLASLPTLWEAIPEVREFWRNSTFEDRVRAIAEVSRISAGMQAAERMLEDAWSS